MELAKNQVVVFSNGHTAGRLEAVWDRKRAAFCIVTDDYDDDGNPIRLYSTTVIERHSRQSGKFVPDEFSCRVQIFPSGETEKAYQIPDGTNGKIGHCREYYKYIAKSICWVDKSGRIFAPYWAV